MFDVTYLEVRAMCSISARRVLSGGLLVFVLALEGTGFAFAQQVAGSDESAAQPVRLKEISVTGTHIKSSNVETDQPIIVINAAQIKASGLTSVGQVLQMLTSAGPSLTLQHNNGNLDGTTTINLRNLGADRTLVLVNGKRWVTSIGGVTDLGTIPASIIDHIEVLQDGASAVYGSDAIAGVINIITKQNFSGTEATAYMGLHNGNSHWDGRTQHYDVSMGTSSEHGNVFVNLSYLQQDGISSQNRTLTSLPTYGTGDTRGSSITPQGDFIFTTPPVSDFAANGGSLPPADNALLQVCQPKKGALSCNLTLKDGATGTSPSDFRPFQTTDKFNGNLDQYILQPNKTTSVYVQGHQDLSPDVTFYVNALYNKKITQGSLAGMPLQLQLGKTDVTISADNPYNPFGFDLDPETNVVNIARRIMESGPRTYTNDDITDRIGFGLTGGFEVGGRAFDWDAGYIYSSDDGKSTNLGFQNVVNLADALGSASQCGAGTTNPSCVPLNLFGGMYNGGSITPAMLGYIDYTSLQETFANMMDYSTDISSSDLVTLPAGGLGVALGAEYLKQSGFFQPDPLIQAGQSTANQAGATSGGYTVSSVYAEVNVPILRDAPAFKDLSLDIASRHSHYSSFGNNTSSRAGLRWQPVGDWLVRGTISQGFRAPAIQDLFQGVTQSSPALTDPCSNFADQTSTTVQNCIAAGVPADGSYKQLNKQIRIQVGGNPDLTPERSLSRTIGFVYSPSQIPGFNFGADYYKIEISNEIGTIGGQQILNGCYIAGVSSYCDRITRAQSGADVGQIITLLNTGANIGDVLDEGIDVNANYTFTTSIGAFLVKLDSSFLKEFSNSNPVFGANGTSIVTTYYAGTESSPYNGYPRNRTNLSATWTSGPWQAFWQAQYISDMIESCTDTFGAAGPLSLAGLGLCSYPNSVNASGKAAPQNKLGAVTYHNVQLSYNFSQINTSVSFGINNLFDKNPPVSYSASAMNYNVDLYPLPGRFFYLRLSTQF